MNWHYNFIKIERGKKLLSEGEKIATAACMLGIKAVERQR